jgi:diadenylate cyclase
MFQGTIFITDILDILIIALLIYSLLLVLRRARYLMMFLGLVIAAGLYLLAKLLNLTLTLHLIQYFGGVALIVLVIIFQSEIRKYFEFLGLIGSRQIKVGFGAAISPAIAEIVQSCVMMSQKKIGALIVIQGRDTIDTYTPGGTDLDGVISEEILMSIFDPHSLGHDGAVIITNNRIQKFAAHLPLSSNFREIGKHGTRHSAALGLTESTDALCIVVSEEQGSISICRNGRLKPLDNYSDLEKELERYISAKFNNKSDNIIFQALSRNFWLKLASFITAAGIWFFSVYHT